jgi:hypothetical protein
MGTKRIDGCIDFRLTKDVVGELLPVFQHFEGQLDKKDVLEGLLYEHVKDIYLRLNDMAIKAGFYGQKSAILILTHAEAYAMYEVISTTDTSEFPYANVILGDWLTKIDKRRKAARV